MRHLINKTSVDALAKGASIVDTKVDGFIARKLPSGKVSYGFRYRGKDHKQWWLSLGVHGQSGVTADTARAQAKVYQGKVAGGKDPGADKQAERDKALKAKLAGKNTVNAVLDQFIARHVEKNLRSAATVKRCLEVYVRPRIGSKSIYDLKRKDIVEMLDAIENADKAPTADRVLAYVRKAFNWYAARDDEFLPPIVKGMARTKPAERARVRALADDEIRSLWQALFSLDSPEPFRNIVRVLLLTAQRRDEIGLMRVEELDGDTLVIPAERYKTGIPNAVPLTTEARQWIGDRKAGFMFSTTDGKKAFSGYSKAKGQLDAVIAKQRKAAKLKPMPEWRLHDLRRTARSLMSRAGVSSDVAEMVLGHKLTGVRGVYDRHSYAEEKRDALEKLAGLIALILSPPTGNVVKLERTA
ncbi:tyrosine-type recombinase/integrase [Bradyrhizobium sp.]|uniref:tyrosine-type recombinase/integrase n=1 Tax=Bradyrhizobium sp. TaxID=376 RepID=UPI003BAEEFB3